MHRLLLLALVPSLLLAREPSKLPADSHFNIYQLVPAPEAAPLMLEKGARLAICGDSITEQKRYSLVIEAYLIACAESTGIGRVASFDRAIDRVDTVERIDP